MLQYEFESQSPEKFSDEISKLNEIRRNFNSVSRIFINIKKKNITGHFFSTRDKDFEKLNNLMIDFKENYWNDEKKHFELVFNQNDKKSPDDDKVVKDLATHIQLIWKKENPSNEKGNDQELLQKLYSSLKDFYKLPDISDPLPNQQVKHDEARIFSAADIKGDGGRKIRSTHRKSGARRSFHRRRQASSRRRSKQQTGRRRRSTYQTRRRRYH